MPYQQEPPDAGSKRWLRATLLLPVLVGSVITLVGTIWLGKMAVFIVRASEAPGVVTQVTQCDSSSEWDLTFTFDDAKGVRRTPQTRFMSPTHDTGIKTGDKVTVLYDPYAPDHAEVKSFETLWFRPLFYFGLGSLFFGGGYLLGLALRFTRRRQTGVTAATLPALDQVPGRFT